MWGAPASSRCLPDWASRSRRRSYSPGDTRPVAQLDRLPQGAPTIPKRCQSLPKRTGGDDHLIHARSLLERLAQRKKYFFWFRPSERSMIAEERAARSALNAPQSAPAGTDKDKKGQ